MKYLQKGLALAAVAGTMAFAAPAISQDNTRVYDQGSVWIVSPVTTKPGQFNAYINDLSKVWRVYLEAGMADGDVLSYKMLSVSFPRDGEPNLLLLVEMRDMAAFDRSIEYFEEQAVTIQGSLDATTTANINRGELRTLNGSIVTRELHFMDEE